MIMNVLSWRRKWESIPNAPSGLSRLSAWIGLNLLAQVASFCIVCFVLYRFAYRPVLAMLEVRRSKSRRACYAEQIKAELARTKPSARK